MSPEPDPAAGPPDSIQSRSDHRFVVDRMLGSLTRYLRFMGYDTLSANGLSPGNAREDTFLLELARSENRILITRDAELARRGKNRAVYIKSEDVIDQIDELLNRGLIERRLLLSRCSLCNTELRQASPEEIGGADYAPKDSTGFTFFWCASCKKLYWNGTHGRRLNERIGGGRSKTGH